MVTDRPSVVQAAGQAWRDTIATLRALMPLVWVALAISIVIAFLQRFVAPTEKAFETGPLLAGFIIACAQAFLLTPYLIAVHRCIILGETETRYRLEPGGHRFQLFLLWSIALSMFYWMPAFTIGSFSKTTELLLLASVLLLIVCVTAMIVSARLVILFPAIAVDAPGATWTNAMADTKGNVWRILLISMLAALPAFAGLIVILLAGQVVGPFLAALLDGAMGLVTVTLAIAVASRLYEQLGDRVNRA
jgi:hypothetical protein